MYILGINAVYHDTAACLMHDGRVIAAAEEERFTRIKHGKRPIPFSTYELPFHAIDYCLREAGITLVDIDHGAYSYDPFLLLGRHRDPAAPVILRSHQGLSSAHRCACARQYLVQYPWRTDCMHAARCYRVDRK